MPTPPSNRPAVVLLSGGLDSATAAAIAQSMGFQLHALTIDYGQRHRFELDAARRVAESLAIDHHVTVPVGLDRFGGSALTDQIEVPKDRGEEAMAHGIPITYVPARNTVFLAIALGFAEVVGAADLFVGVNAVDYSGYPDCRPEFIAAFQRLANVATRQSVEGDTTLRIHAPLIDWSKSQIIRRGTELGVPYQWTHTCYDPGLQGIACGRCDACQLRRAGFREAGRVDPIRYADRSEG
ncbi:MAG: 7-cyano-7-deazaguanine synthase QueC [Pirellulales bacterium]